MTSRTLLGIIVPLLLLSIAPSNASETADLPPLAVHFMLRGYFHAASPVRDSEALGGFWRSDNLPRVIDFDVPSESVILLALPDETTLYNSSYSGFRVVLANATKDQLILNAADSRLRIVREALDSEGKWKPIEYLPSSWCGNSYHRVFLPPGQYWSFTAPTYSGSLPTMMRFVLYPSGDAEPLYSNEFPGSVNPEQFSVRRGHSPKSIMDPYVD